MAWYWYVVLPIAIWLTIAIFGGYLVIEHKWDLDNAQTLGFSIIAIIALLVTVLIFLILEFKV